MRTVEDHLVAGVSVNGGHDTALNGRILVKSISHRSKAVGGAGCSGDDLVVRGKGLLVYAVNDGLKIVSSGSGDNDLLCACVDVSLRLLLGAVEAGALENYVYADLTPRKIRCVLLAVNGDLLAVYDDVSLARLNGMRMLADLSAVTALCGIVLEKVSKHSGIGKVVDCNYFISLRAEHLAESKATDTAESVNGNFY